MKSSWQLLVALVGMAGVTFGAATAAAAVPVGVEPGGALKLTVRSRRLATDGARYEARFDEVRWNTAQTAIVVCDMWDSHWCKGASERVAEIAPRMNEFLKAARKQGVLIVHAPSSCMEPYKDHPARRRAQAAPQAKNLPKEIGTWCRHIPAEEQGRYPIDQTDGGCDCEPKCPSGNPWRRQVATIEIDESDAISDSGVEIWNLFEQRGIQNAMLVGVHTNMCVLGRPFGLRNLARHGKNVVLVRDLTDTMYNSRAWPYVSHFRGTDLIVEHIEKFVCPTITSDQVLGGSPFHFKADVRPRVVLAISEDEYKTAETLPVFAREVLEAQLGLRTTILHGDPKNMNVVPGLAESLKTADLILLSMRRRAMPEKDLAAVREFLQSGRPLVGIRTASHAFHTRGKTETGHAEWQTFDPDVLGGNYTGHHGNDLKPRVAVVAGNDSHPILTGVFGGFSSGGSLYKVSPLAPGTTPLLTGTIPGQPAEPVAWTNHYGKSRVFYTSLGHIDDFNNPQFVQLLANGVRWALNRPTETQPLAGTKPLEMEGDIASQLVAGVDRFLLREIDKSIERRQRHWKRDLSGPEAYTKSVEPNRRRLAHILGMRDARVPFDGPELVATTASPALVARNDRYEVFVARWPAFGDVHGEGLLLVPTKGKPRASVVAIPDADQTPEQICGLAEGVPEESQFARRLADNGCRVLVPVLIDRKLERRNGRANLTSREFVYRSAFELGRHLIGYEVQKVLAGVDWFVKDAGAADPNIGVFGYGEGGLVALCAAAIDTRIDVCGVSGFFGSRQKVWNEPIDRNVFGLLDQFGDAELATLVAPRMLVVENRGFPQVTLPSEGGAPAELGAPTDTLKELQRAERLLGGAARKLAKFTYVDVGPEKVQPVFGGVPALSEFLGALDVRPEVFINDRPPAKLAALPDAAARQRRQIHELDRHNQKLLVDSPYVRTQFMNIGLVRDDKQDGSNKLDTSSPDAYANSVERFREVFRNDVVGRFDLDPLPANPRTRKTYDHAKWTGYEVVLDVFPDVIAYGVLLLPKDLKLDGSEKRPVVVCQHGLEGRPRDTIQTDVDGFKYYSAFAARLAERGFITFAPQNLYIFQDRFRTLQRKANPLGKTLFSIIVPQHQQITDWLKSLPYVDPDRIGFYGLSYGGKSAMRIPSLVSNYCLSICSADFNEWVWKNASSHPRNNYTYVWTGEYEIFEFDLGSTFNYAEMAALIAPRPFMVERGHFDGVAPDETVAYEFAKVFHLYNARLKLGDRCELEWFPGPHTINGQATYDFLHKHLKWPKRQSE